MKYWIWLSRVLGPASAKLKPLIDRYETAQRIYQADLSELDKMELFTRVELKRFADKKLSYSERILDQCEQSGIKIVAYHDPSYPERLRQIVNPPACFYYKGTLPDVDREPMICIVGQRKATDYGLRAAWSLSARLTAGGMTVVSGGAKGIDAAAHNGALDVGGKTVALLGCGINYPYLLKNAPLREKIAENGCLISEYPPNEKVYKQNFLIRNRLMSALSLGVIVIEAPSISGSLNTAAHALEQGRDVFVITGRPDDPNCAGTNALLRDGAKPVFDVDDVFAEYVGSFPDKIDSVAAKQIKLKPLYQKRFANLPNFPQKMPKIEPTRSADTGCEKILQEKIDESLSKNAQIVYNSIDSDFFTIDDLLNCGLPFEEILVAVTELEIAGAITAEPGGRYSIL